jgi:hypothetical protein
VGGNAGAHDSNVRYLVVIPPERSSDEATFCEVERDEVEPGDTLVVDDFVLHVHSIVDVPAEGDFDATLVCTPEPARPAPGA